jgi:hypothetical protein
MKRILAAVLLFVCGSILFLPPASAQSLKVGMTSKTLFYAVF